MEPFELEPIIIVPDYNGNTDQTCQIFFYGDYHYCGDAGAGLVQCCLGAVS